MDERFLDFELPVIELEKKIDELRELTNNDILDCSQELEKLTKKQVKLQNEIFENLTPWQTTQLARHPNRPYVKDYLQYWDQEWLELHGDRNFGDDKAIIGCLAKIGKEKVVIIGQQKGRDTKEKIAANFGMPNPEGYRKSLRLMRLAAKFKLPIITLIDTPGAYPGVGAEERGQSGAIATNLMEMFALPTPIISIICGEGGSGGALALGIGDRVLMLQHSIYSVISPESCAAILLHDSSKAEEVAGPLKITAKNLAEFGIIDEVLQEPKGGAHRDHQATATIIQEAILKHLTVLKQQTSEELLVARHKKFRDIGNYLEL